MKWIVLTTQTPHHAYFVREVHKAFPLQAVILEESFRKPPFDTAHDMERQRDEYERLEFFGGEEPRMGELARTHGFPSVNDPACVELIRSLDPDVILSFGTGKIGPELIGIRPQAILNLHGGDPREYRGLDSHYWAVYHGDFGNLATTLHRLNPELDDGEMVLMASVPVTKGMELHQLRSSNTGVCIRLTLAALDMHARHGGFLSAPQGKRGRYYSFMPAPLKEICRRKFRAFAETLP